MINKFAGIKYHVPEKPKKSIKNIDLRYEENSKITAFCFIAGVLTVIMAVLTNLLF